VFADIVMAYALIAIFVVVVVAIWLWEAKHGGE
jgi:hypothetical protein